MGVVCLPNGFARLAEAPHRAMRAALYHLKAAKEEVKEERFKRHRERVEKDIEIAIKEIERGLGEAKIDLKFEPVVGWDKGYKDFKNLRQALVDLDLAKEEISKEKGEWAKRKELKEAIEESHKHIKEALEEIK
jgi:hypothetical protein